MGSKTSASAEDLRASPSTCEFPWLASESVASDVLRLCRTVSSFTVWMTSTPWSW
jgi:hypothetical protein